MTDAEFQAELDKQQAEKQAAAQTSGNQQQLEKAKREVVAAVIASTKANMQHRENTTTKVDVQNDIASTEDVNRAVEAINNLALLMLSNPQPQVSSNNAEVVLAIQKLGDILDKLPTSFPEAPEPIETVTVKNQPDYTKQFADLNSAVKSIKINPVVNVAAPKVTVPKLDTSGIEAALANALTQDDEEDGLDLDDYMAHDLDEMEQGVQYVGFVNSKGNWYIVKNVEAENSLRYAFGTDAYADFWPRASQLDYTLLNEALHAA